MASRLADRHVLLGLIAVSSQIFRGLNAPKGPSSRFGARGRITSVAARNTSASWASRSDSRFLRARCRRSLAARRIVVTTERPAASFSEPACHIPIIPFLGRYPICVLLAGPSLTQAREEKQSCGVITDAHNFAQTVPRQSERDSRLMRMAYRKSPNSLRVSSLGTFGLSLPPSLSYLSIRPARRAVDPRPRARGRTTFCSFLRPDSSRRCHFERTR